jgi:hypothetical protein
MRRMRDAATNLGLNPPGINPPISIINMANKLNLNRPISLTNLVRYIWARLNFVVQHQQQTNWCWAAVSCSISIYYNLASLWTQCTIVNAEFNRTDCCTIGSSANCNSGWYLDRALNRTGNLASMLIGTVTMGNIRNEIDNNRPISARTQWPGGSGHFLAIGGYNVELDSLVIEDPWWGNSDVTLATFTNSYMGSGTWSHTYYTQP